MAAGTTADSARLATEPAGQNYTLPMVLMVTLYFSIGFITALNDILIPHFKDLFHLNNFLALLVQLAFFGAYFVMSIPSGWIVNAIGYKMGIVTALAIMGLGLLLFLPASAAISYPLFLFGLFVVGSGLALLQVAINPYVGALGAPETAASRLNLCGGLNSLASTIAPKVGAAFIFIAAGASAAQLAHSVRGPYLVLACFAFLLSIVTYFMPLPQLLDEHATRTEAEGSALRFRHLRLGAVAIFTYVGAEVAIGSIMIAYLGQPSMGSMSHQAAAKYVSLYWAGAMVGRFIGFAVLRHVSAQRALAAVSMVAAALMAVAIFGHGPLALWSIVACGLFNSVMWPCIFPLSVKGLGRFTSQGSGILITMVVGGAVIPALQGLLADHFGYQPSFGLVLCCYLYLVFFALSGYRIIQPRFDSLPGYLPPLEG